MRRGWRRFQFVALAALLGLASDGLAMEQPPAEFFRGLNLNGPALLIDGHAWEGKDSTHYECKDHELDIPTVPLKPPTDHARTRMLRTSRWGTNMRVKLTDLLPGDYQVCLYVWEDNNATNFSVSLNGKVVHPRYDSRSAGHWEKLGPWPVHATDGTITVSSNGGDANFSGIEVWKGLGPLPAPRQFVAQANQALSAADLEFFEKKIRPVLVERCYSCHSAEAKKLRGELLVDSRAGLVRGGATGPALIPGDPARSLLLAAVRGDDPDLKMPPDQPLTKAQIADLEEWIQRGAPDPRTENKPLAKVDWAKAREFWSFRPLAGAAPPLDAASTHPIDAFIVERLRQADLRPPPRADRRTLLRRATFDLTGLPPTPEELADFQSDQSPNAWERVIDRLLASPAYGERWGRHWLDLARYADTSGCNSDFPVPTAYLYRNWVIKALNADMPYHQFIRTQLAGDLLPFATEEERQQNIIATGYLAIGRRFGSLADEFHLTIEDNIDNLGKAVLGLSVSCARCHDHKFDPITLEDYYGLYGIFESTSYAFPGTEIPPEPKDFVPLVAPDVLRKVVQPLEAELARLNRELHEAEKRIDPLKKKLEMDKSAENEAALQEARRVVDRLRQKRDELQNRIPRYLRAYAVSEGTPADARLQRKGDPRQAGPTVQRGFLQVLGGQRLTDPNSGSGRRELADWVTQANTPLAARVLANRVWQLHFGEGLVRTPSDFGSRGQPPTHPELLDWLARFILEDAVQPWSLKRLHRLIMTSETYQQAVVADESALARDPRNELLWSFRRRRLSAEEYRDALLMTSGSLDRSPGEGHPFPAEPFKFTQHKPFVAVYDTPRRSVYLMQQRIKKHPWLEVFDGADPNAITAQRPLNTTPIQALTVMNDPLVHQLADRFAAQVLNAAAADESRLDWAYGVLLCRAPTDPERELSLAFLQQIRESLGDSQRSGRDAERAAWASWARTVWAGNEFVFLD